MSSLVSLGDFISTQKGYAFKSKWYSKEGHPIVKVSDFTSDSIDSTKLVLIPDDVACNYSRYTLNTNDVIIQTVGSWPSNPASVVGKAVRVPKSVQDALLNQNAVKLIPNEKINNGYLFYLLRSDQFKDYIVGTAQGAASQASITLDSIKAFTFEVPLLSIQQKIASILSSYDNQIENNNYRIAILEDMAQKLYREWFVKFRFPGYEEIEMVVSELGEIPERWEVVSASDTMEINPRTTLTKEGEKPYLSMSYLSENSMVIKGNEYRSGNSGTKFKNSDTLFARITPSLENGKTGYVQFLDDENPIGFGSTEFIVLRSKTLTPEYVYCLARSENFRANAIKSMTGATGRQRVQNSCFDNYFFAQPSEDTLKQFTVIVRSMFELIDFLHRKNLNLRQQRDLLLPKLISGKIDV